MHTGSSNFYYRHPIGYMRALVNIRIGMGCIFHGNHRFSGNDRFIDAKVGGVDDFSICSYQVAFFHQQIIAHYQFLGLYVF